MGRFQTKLQLKDLIGAIGNLFIVFRCTASEARQMIRFIIRRLRRNMLLSVILLVLAPYIHQRSRKPKIIELQEVWNDTGISSFTDKLRVDCDPAYHHGPYVFIETPTDGFFNQYLKLTSSLHLVRSFPGTIVFPQYSKSRSAYADYYETNWTLVDSKKFYDVDYLIKYWRHRNVTMCQGSVRLNVNSEWLNQTSFCEQIVPYKQRQLKLKRKVVAKQYCNYAYRLYLTPTNFTTVVLEYFAKHLQRDKQQPLQRNDAITVTPAWKMLPSTYYRKSDRYFATVRDSVLSLKLAANIIALGEEILLKVKEKRKVLDAPDYPIVGVHARIEKDWYHRTASVESADSVLDRFQQRIKQLTYKPGMVYIAVGDLDLESSRMLRKWANINFGRRWMLKKSLNIQDKLDKIPLEAQAAVDFVALTGMDFFFGQAFSSFDVVTYDFRSYTGRTSNLLNFIFDEFRPTLTIRRCIF